MGPIRRMLSAMTRHGKSRRLLPARLLGLLWLPVFWGAVRGRVRRHGIVRVAFELLLLVQLGHLGEHVIQMAQLFVLGWPPAAARGFVSQLDVEKVHFFWNLAVLGALGWFLWRGLRSGWLLTTLAWATLHTAEHGYLLAQALRTGLEGQPGVLGAGGLLASLGVTVPGFTTWSRATVHFFWNSGEMALLLLAFLVLIRPGWQVLRPRRGWALTPLAGALGVLGLVVFLPSAAHAPHTPLEPFTALASVEVVADGFRELRGVAVDGDGFIYVADREAGTVTKIALDHTKTIVATGLERPIGLALDSQGRLLIAEEKAGKVVRLEPSGALTVLVQEIKQPRWLAVSDESGTLYISARRLPRGTDPEPDDESAEPEVILALSPSGQLRVFADGFRHLQGLAVADGVLYAATRGLRDGSKTDGVIFKIPILSDGTAGPVSQLGPSDSFKKPVGLALDRLGALFFTTKELTVEADKSKRAIGKLFPDGRVSLFASNLENPQGLAFDAQGNLLLVDGNSGRVLRFRAPPSPAVIVPSFTNQSPLTVQGKTEANSRIDAFLNDAAEPITLLTQDGSFSLTLNLTPNTQNLLTVFTTSHNGDGLTSAPAEFTIVHDNITPAISNLQPLSGSFLNTTTPLIKADFSDNLSRVDVGRVEIRLDGIDVTSRASVSASGFTLPFNPSTLEPLNPLTEGSHTVLVSIADRAGNSASASTTFTVDVTPPDTQITGGPAGDIGETTATFTFTGTDNFTPVASLLFAWRLDGRPWSPFSSETTVTLTGLTEGPHTFEVKAQDLAGNEDPTPASRSFTVSFRPVITRLDPASGTIGTLVNIHGTGFRPGETQVAFNGVSAVLRSLTTSLLTVTVPPGARSGPVTVTTSKGTGTSPEPFTVVTNQDFAVEVVPTSGQVLQGASTTYTIELQSLGTEPFSGLATLALDGLPSGITGTFGSSTLTGGQRGTLTLSAESTAALGTFTFTLKATAPTEIGFVTRTANVTVTVQQGGRTALIGQITFVDGTPIEGVRLALGDQSTAADAGGNFKFLDPPEGTQMLGIDANAAQPGLPIYAVDVTLIAGQATQLPPLRITPPPLPESFTPINNSTQDQIVTDSRFPGVSITLPAGVTITGWDGVLKNKITIERLTPDQLPVPPPPGPTRSLYQIFFGTPMGGLPSAPLPVTVPNDQEAAPGEQVEIWYYDAAPLPGAAAAWRLAGLGTVSEDGTRIVSDPGVGIQRFCGVCGLFCFIRNQAGQPSLNPSGPRSGEPVDLATGQMIVEKTDLVLSGRLPSVIHRTYNPFDPFGRIAGFELALGLGWALSVDVALQEENASLRRIILPGNARFAFVKQADGSFVNTTHPRFAGAVLTQSGTSHTLSFKDGTTWRFAPTVVAGPSLLVEQADRNGNRVTVERIGRSLTRLIEPGGRALTFAYNSQGRIASITDPLGRTVRYGYNLTTRRLETVTDPAGGVTRYTYDSEGRILTITDARGIVFIQNEHDTSGRVVKQTQADSGVWTFQYVGAVGAHTQVTVTDPRGKTTIHRMNNAGFASEAVDALGQATKTARDAKGQVISATDPLGRVLRFEYDTTGNVTRITDPAGNMRTFTYEPTFNKVTSITDPLGNLTTFEYDAKGNLTATVDPLGNRTTIAYNSFGQPISTTDPLGNVTTFTYDTAGNLITITDPLGNKTNREYDTVSRLVKQTDPRGRPTTFAYDALNRLKKLTDPASGVTQFSYDGNGNLLAVTDARGNAIQHTYDTMDRLATRTDPVGALESFLYDGMGNLTQHTDRKGQANTFSYDPLNRRTGGGYADGATTNFIYDAVGRLIEATDSVGGTIVNQYDILDRLVAQITALGTVSYQYDSLGRRTRMDAPGQAPVTYGYDAASRLTQVVQGTQMVELAYDASGRRTQLTLPNGVSTEYQYDAASRLTALIYRNTLGVLGDLTYGYDVAGNRTRVGGSFARTLLPDPVPSATYDAANRQLTLGDKTLSYDANGNLISLTDVNGTILYTWNARNQLVGISGPDMNASFVYDGLGRRVKKTIDNNSTEFLYDGVNPVQEISSATVLANILTGLRVDEYFARSDASGTSFFLPGALRSTVALAGTAGTIQTEYTYEPFGKISVNGVSSTNPFQYTSRENDGTGLYYYRNRYYHPQLQRFISEDPIEFYGGDINLYAYVWNNPLRYLDPFGLRHDRIDPPGSGCMNPTAPCRRPPGPPPGSGRKDPPKPTEPSQPEVKKSDEPFDPCKKFLCGTPESPCRVMGKWCAAGEEVNRPPLPPGTPEPPEHPLVEKIPQVARDLVEQLLKTIFGEK